MRVTTVKQYQYVGENVPELAMSVMEASNEFAKQIELIKLYYYVGNIQLIEAALADTNPDSLLISLILKEAFSQ